jgi:hypothetical protein
MDDEEEQEVLHGEESWNGRELDEDDPETQPG